MKKTFIFILALVLTLALTTACNGEILQLLLQNEAPQPESAHVEPPQTETPSREPAVVDPIDPTPEEAHEAESTPSDSEPLITSSLTDANIAEAFLQVLLAEGPPILWDWGDVRYGVINVSIADLDNDGIPELIFSRSVDFRFDVLIYGFVDDNLEALIRLESIEANISSPSFSAYSLYGGGFIADGSNGGCCGGWYNFFTYKNLQAVPTVMQFSRTWGGCCSGDNDTFYINDAPVSEEEYYAEFYLLKSERVYFLTGHSFAVTHTTRPNLSMTYDKAIAYLSQHLTTPIDLSANNNEADYIEYILPFSNTRLITDADLHGLSSSELRIARNEIFARHGRLFNDPELSDWFMARAWYRDIQPKFTPAEFDDLKPNPLSSIEMQNIDIITARENIVN